MAANITDLTDTTFDEVVKASDVPVLVDFWAEWCGPCRIVGPILEDIAQEHAGSVRIAKVNVDENPRLTERFAVQSIPTMILFKDGDATDLRLIGARAKPQLVEQLKPYL